MKMVSINKEDAAQNLVYGVVYEPDTLDSHEDFMTAAAPLNLYDTATPNKAGAIARKLGITWGGDWKASNIDRPYFEVKANWKKPTGYKLVGSTTIPTSSKERLVWMAPMVAMDEPKKEEEELFNQQVKQLKNQQKKY